MNTKNILINKLSKEIKIKGFKKTGLTWLSECDPFVYVINIQPGKYVDENEEYFTIYIGVFSSNEYLTRVNLMGAARPECDTIKKTGIGFAKRRHGCEGGIEAGRKKPWEKG